MKGYTLERLIQVAITLRSEKNIDAILELILEEAMDITACDGGTLYIREGDHLLFDKMITLSKGVKLSAAAGEIDLPPVPLTRRHVCSCAVLDNIKINIEDVYESEQYDFSGAQKYDALNGYRTGSMLVIPMEDDRGDVIGVLQLINALDEEGRRIPFGVECEGIISALASLAAVSLNNNKLSQALMDMLHSFVRLMVGAIDTRSSYNANHTKSMVSYAERFMDWLQGANLGWSIDERERDPFLMSIWLHDIGKLVVPLEVMDKATRLGTLEQGILSRIDIAILMERIRGLENAGLTEETDAKQILLAEARDVIVKANTAGFLQEETIAQLKELAATPCMTAEGAEIPLLNERELEAITVQKGTLTAAERKQMEAHVVYTSKLLSEIDFVGDYARVPFWAGAHHELLDGSGYPEHKKAEELPKEVRLLTILDIYDALTAEDRPYKPPMPPQKAFGVLESMRDEGKLDGELLQMFRDSEAWKKSDEDGR